MQAVDKVRSLMTRLALLPLWVLGRLPLPLGRLLLRPLAPVLRLLMRRRSAIARRNLALCLPDWSDPRREALLKRHFRHLAESVAEIAMCWYRPGRLDTRHGQVHGLDHLEQARVGGQGVVLVTGHVTCLEMGARLFGEQVDACGIYRPLRNLVLNQAQNRGRSRYAQAMIPRDELRTMVRHLRAGGVLWYAPDQDFGAERSVFAPFFGVPTATAHGLLELARLGRAVVVPMFPVKDETSGRVTVLIGPAFNDFPSGDHVADLTRFNAFLEEHIRSAPAQYWWLHRRFKTRPDGESPRYG